jgi:hypothetical protein
MELTGKKPLIISCGIGQWYSAGIDRLERSLLFHGYPGDTLFWRDQYPPGCPPIEDNPYAFKPYAFAEGFGQGYDVVLWLDASFWAIRNPMPIFDYIIEHGFYFFKSGYPLSATTTDRILEYTGFIREDLQQVSEFATGAVGLNINNPMGKQFFLAWMKYCKEGLFAGHRTYNEADSQHHLFKHARQDQSAASMILHRMGITTAGENEHFVAYYNSPYNAEKCLFFINGL